MTPWVGRSEGERYVAQTGTKRGTELPFAPGQEDVESTEPQAGTVPAKSLEILQLLWNERRVLVKSLLIGFVLGAVLAFLLPKRYTATTQLMPPDTQSTSGMAMMAAMAARAGAGGVGSVAGDLLGLKSSGALFIGVLRSRTSQDRLIEQFDLKNVYGTRLVMDARIRLDENTSISEDRKSGIITINVTDRSPQRAAAIATAYVDQLNLLVTELSTSAAHRERVFLEERLKAVKLDLDDASNQLAQFSSKNNTLDIQLEGKAMLDVAASLAGQMVAAQSQLEGLRQIYTDNNPRVQSLNARVGELRKQLDKLGGTKLDPSVATAIPRSGDMPYPTIRNLPLLGVKYADYYRHTKIQETVYELLTEQYELAKVQEAKETPSVKILDPAYVPERKAFPPRTLITLTCAFFALLAGCVWIVGRKRWEQIEANDPGKVFARDVFRSVNSAMPWATPNGSSWQAMTHRAWLRMARRKAADVEADSLPK